MVRMKKYVAASLSMIVLAAAAMLYAGANSTLDADGVLHEPFFLIPVGYALGIAAVVTLVVGLIRSRRTV